jgi:hypothetical protein
MSSSPESVQAFNIRYSTSNAREKLHLIISMITGPENKVYADLLETAGRHFTSDLGR